MRQNPNLDAESVLLRLLEMPEALFDRNGTTSLIAFDEFQDVLAVQLFADPSRPLMNQAVQRRLDPLPINEVANYVTSRFQLTQRDPGPALDPLLEFTRGHPQRSMMLAHYLWHRTPYGGSADESTWLAALDQVNDDESQLMYATWGAMKPNERRIARALATTSTPLWSEDTAALVGIKRSSIGRTLGQLQDTADVIQVNGRPRLTDPVFEHWLRTRELLPDDGAEDD